MKNVIIGAFVIMGILAVVFWLCVGNGMDVINGWLHMLGIR